MQRKGKYNMTLQELGFHKVAVSPEILKRFSNDQLYKHTKRTIEGARNITQAISPELQRGNKYVGLGLATRHTPEKLNELKAKAWKSVLDNVAEIKQRALKIYKENI